MIRPDENLERRLSRFRRRPAPEGLKAKILAECRRRAAEGPSRTMTPRLWTIFTIECAALLFFLVVIPGSTAKGKHAEFFGSSGAPETAAGSLSPDEEIIEEASILSAAEKACFVRRLSFGRAETPRRQRRSLARELEDFHEKKD
jgi:hypothetical protein